MLDRSILVSSDGEQKVSFYERLCDGVRPQMYFHLFSVHNCDDTTALYSDFKVLYEIMLGSDIYDECKYLLFFHFNLFTKTPLQNILIAAWKALAAYVPKEHESGVHLQRQYTKRSMLTGFLNYFNAAILFLLNKEIGVFLTSENQNRLWLQNFAEHTEGNAHKIVRIMCAHLLRSLTTQKDLGIGHAGQLLALYVNVLSTAHFVRSLKSEKQDIKESLALVDEVSSWLSRALESIYQRMIPEEQNMSFIEAFYYGTKPFLHTSAKHRKDKIHEFPSYLHEIAQVFFTVSEKAAKLKDITKVTDEFFVDYSLKCLRESTVHITKMSSRNKMHCSVFACVLLLFARSLLSPKNFSSTLMDKLMLLVQNLATDYEPWCVFLFKGMANYSNALRHKLVQHSISNTFLLKSAATSIEINELVTYHFPQSSGIKNSLDKVSLMNMSQLQKLSIVKLTRSVGFPIPSRVAVDVLQDTSLPESERISLLHLLLCTSPQINHIRKKVYNTLNKTNASTSPIFWKTVPPLLEKIPQSPLTAEVEDALCESIVSMSKNGSILARANLLSALPIPHTFQVIAELNTQLQSSKQSTTFTQQSLDALEVLFWQAGDIMGSDDCTTGFELSSTLTKDLVELREALKGFDARFRNRKRPRHDTPYTLQKAIRYFEARTLFKLE